VTIGKRFHWERKEDQTFQGDLILQTHKDGTVSAINEIPLEDYLKSVISSEMSVEAPIEFLKAHAILSRSWLLVAFNRKKKAEEPPLPRSARRMIKEEVMRWYDREDHDLYDVCNDDHCQRYHGVTKIISNQAEEAVQETRGMVITHQDQICDTRYSKACGGLTEEFATAWDDKRIPYLTSISDASIPHPPIKTEKEASTWILSEPEAYCNSKDEHLLKKILPDFDRETKEFFRWRIEYSRKELEEILQENRVLISALCRKYALSVGGPSGRIYQLKIVGSKRSRVVERNLKYGVGSPNSPL